MGNSKPYVVQVDGGIGRVICAVPAIEKLSKTKKVTVITSHPEVFWNNPFVYKVYNLSREYLWDDVIKNSEFLFPEPYFNHLYYTQKHHLIQSFDMLLNGGEGKFFTPRIYLSHDEIKWANDFIQGRRKDSGKKIAMLQCFGSLAKIVDTRTVDVSNRSLPTNIITAIISNSDCTYINASHIPVDLPNVWNQEFTLRQIFALTAACDFIVSVDSMLMHIGAAFDKVGLAFFGGTYPANLGYPNYRMVVRDGYPKSYIPNRFSGFIDENQGALDFDTNEIQEIVKIINKYDFPSFDEVFPKVEKPKSCTVVKNEIKEEDSGVKVEDIENIEKEIEPEKKVIEIVTEEKVEGEALNKSS
jgi:ADP-heptose:LPS heptosyltransferase